MEKSLDLAVVEGQMFEGTIGFKLFSHLAEPVMGKVIVVDPKDREALCLLDLLEQFVEVVGVHACL